MISATGLWVTPPPRHWFWHDVSRLRFPIAVTLLTGAILTIGFGFARFRYGSFDAALAAARGEVLLAEDYAKSIEGVLPGSHIALNDALTNVSNQPIQLVGMSSSCTCTVMENLPLTIAPHQSRTITAMVTTDPAEPDFTGTIKIFTDHPNSIEIMLSYRVRQAESRSTESRKRDP